MKKKVFLAVCTWLLCQGPAVAEELTVSNVTVPQGGTAELTVGYKFTSTTDKVGFTFRIALPEGVSFVKDDDGDPVYVKDATSIDKMNIVCPGEGNFAGQPSNATATIRGTEGTLLTLTLEADAGLAVGSSFDVTVTKATFQERVDGRVRDINLSDFTFSITIGEPDDGRMKFYESETSLPAYTPGEKADVTLYRSIRANEWSTLVLPFNLTRGNAETVFGSDVEMAQFAGFTVDYGEDEENVKPLGITIGLSKYTIPARGNLAGGTPILIKTSKDIEKIELDNVTLTEGIKEVSKADEYETPGKLTGTLVRNTIPEDGLFLSGNQFWYSTGATKVKAFRCWFELGAVLNKDTDFGAKVSFVFDEGETTGISDKRHEATDDRYYNLGGQRVASPGKGLYIKNNRKVVVR